MTTVTIPNLPSTATVNDGDLTVIDQGGTTYKITHEVLVGSGGNTSTGGGYFSTVFGYDNSYALSLNTVIGISNTASDYQSIAIGWDNQAIAGDAVAFGNENIVSGERAIACGYSNTASGYDSTIIGSRNTVSGEGATGCGYQNSVSTYQSCAFGAYNTVSNGTKNTSVGWGNLSNGHQTTACGYNNTASGYYSGSSAIGYLNSTAGLRANGSPVDGPWTGHASAIGYRNVAAGYYMSSAVGASNTVRGDYNSYCSAFGYNNYISADGITNASAFGSSNIASEGNASSFGCGNTASAIYCTAFGAYNIANQPKASAVGFRNTASNNQASAFGCHNTASGIMATACGYNNTASNYYSVAIGAQNTVGAFNSVAIGFTNNNPSQFFNSFMAGQYNVGAAYSASAVGQCNYTTSMLSNAFGNFNLAGYISWEDVSYDIIGIEAPTILAVSDPNGYLNQSLSTYQSYNGLPFIQIENNFGNNGVYFVYGSNNDSGTTALNVFGLVKDTVNGTVVAGGQLFNLSNNYSTISIAYYNSDNFVVTGNQTWISDYLSADIPIYARATGGNITIALVTAIYYDGENTSVTITGASLGSAPTGNLEIFSPIYWQLLQQLDPVALSIISVNQESNDFVVSGDLLGYSVMGYIIVTSSTGNNGVYTINEVTYNGTNTTFRVYQSIPSSTADGVLQPGQNIAKIPWYSTAIGNGNQSIGQYSLSLGGKNTNSGYYAVAAGYGNTVSNYGSQAFGIENTASAEYSIAIGYRSVVYGEKSVAAGIYCTANGNHASSFGESSSATEDFAVAIGYSNTASGNSASSVGVENSASGEGSVACGYYNTVSTYQSCCFGAYNTAAGEEKNVAVGYGNTANVTHSSAVGYGNITSSNYASAFGFVNNASQSYTSAFGSNNYAQANYSSAFGSANTASGAKTSAFGYNNSAFVESSSAFGAYNTTSGYYANAFGYQNIANDTKTSAFGYGNTAAGEYASAFGYSNSAYASYSTAIGSNAQARIEGTTNVGGPIIIRKDNDEDNSSFFQFLSLSGTESILTSVVVDLTNDSSAVEIDIPDGASFFPNECGIIITHALNVTGQPTIEFGDEVSVSNLVSATETTALTAFNNRQRFTSLSNYNGHTTLTANVTIGGSADNFTGRFYWKGMLIEDTVEEVPEFSSGGGSYYSPENITISVNYLPDSSIYYTTDGSTPNTGSTLYTGSFDVLTSQTITALAVSSRGQWSDISDAQVYNMTVATPTFETPAGSYVNEFSVTIDESTPGASVYYTTDGSTPTTGSTLYTSAVAVDVSLTLKAFAVLSGANNSVVHPATYTLLCANPTASPIAGTYYGTQSITLSSVTSGVSIYYTTDGTTPTTSSTLYTGAFDVAATEAVKVLVHKSGFTDSSVVEFDYVIDEAVPTVTTDEFDNHYNFSVTFYGTVVSDNGSDLTAYGFVWNTTGTPTLSDNVVEVGSGAFTGSFNSDVGSLPNSIVYVSAYATNGIGSTYGDVLSGYPGPCLMRGTKVTLLDGTKKNIEDITYEDRLLTWNFDEGKLDGAKPVWMTVPWSAPVYALIKFSDGSELGTVDDGQGHRIFNMEKGMFTHLMNKDAQIGTLTYTENGEVISVVSRETIKEPTMFYNIMTDKHINMFANNILTSTGLNNIYPVVDMKFVKDEKVVRWSKEDFNVPDEIFNGLRLAEQPLSYPDLKEKINRLVEKQL